MCTSERCIKDRERESKPYPDDWVYLYGKTIKDIEVHMGIS
jgi:hypothetical protein